VKRWTTGNELTSFQGMQIYQRLTHQRTSHRRFILCRKICGVGKEGKISSVSGEASRRRKAKAQEMSYAIAGVTEKPTLYSLLSAVGNVTITQSVA
jgi:hypothetical protein